MWSNVSVWNSVWNLENPLQKHMICWRKFMVMSFYLVLKFSSDLKGLKRKGKRSEGINALSSQHINALSSQHIKNRCWDQKSQWNCLTELSPDHSSSCWANWHCQGNCWTDFTLTISTWKNCVRKWCLDSSFLNKKKFEWTFVLTFFKTLKMTQTF